MKTRTLVIAVGAALTAALASAAGPPVTESTAALQAADASFARVFADSAIVPGFPPAVQPANLVLRDATIETLIPGAPQAQAIAIRGDRIEAIGSDAAISRYVGTGTQVIDLHGAFVTPGFIDGHAHPLDTGRALMRLNVGAPKSWDGIVAMVKAAVAEAKPGAWIVGDGWQQNKWTHVPEPNYKGLPLPASLDAVSPNNPVLLNAASGHGIYVNAAALKAADITDKTPDPPGGTILRDNGHIIGMLNDTAAQPVEAAYQRYLKELPAAEREQQEQQALKLATQDATSKGITTVVDMSGSFEDVDWLRKQAAQGKLPMRIYVNIDDESIPSLQQHLADFHRSYANDHIIMGGLGEDVSDGALGTRSAWFLEPYSDDPGNYGKNVVSMSTLSALAKFAAVNHLQMSIHAIGDRANHEMLDLYQKIFTLDPAARALRWRIEHAQHLNPIDIPRFAQLGIIASMQSIHECSDEPMIMARIGAKRAEEGTYVWRKLIDSGAMVVDGTDTPVEDTNPIPNFYCGVTRVTQFSNGTHKAFFPDEAKTRMEELRSYTWNNAYAIFQEQNLGSLAPGKLADIDVWSGNFLTMPADDILRTRVLYTIVGGSVVYESADAASWRSGQLLKAMPEFDHAE